MTSAGITIGSIMESSGVQFGTSGARGLADAMTDRVCFAYTLGFLQHMEAQGLFRSGTQVAIAGDLRPSSPRILRAVACAIRHRQGVPVYCGNIPTPAVSLYGISRGIPSIMVTGSHIPDDRNGIKFNQPAGEILKSDEEGIRAQRVALREAGFDLSGAMREPSPLPVEVPAAYRDYVHRYHDFFPDQPLKGRHIGLYQHSSVIRTILADILEGLGAKVTRLGWSDTFVPVDTEAVRREDVALAQAWAAEGRFDAIVSADGDGDRPLIADETGRWLRGDVVGVLTAGFLGIRRVVTPVSSNTVVERCGWFERVVRTRIGSPYVIAAMQAHRGAPAEGATVAGYEANGGFLLETPLVRNDQTLAPLPTRDAVLPILAVLLKAFGEGRTISELVGALPPRFTASDRLQRFPTEKSRALLAQFATGDERKDHAAIERLFGTHFGRVIGVDRTDGLRITFDSQEIAHLRPSGNAPELRCYTEADSDERAWMMIHVCTSVLEKIRRQST